MSSSSSSSPSTSAAAVQPSGPCIDVFVTSILSNPAIRGRHERTRRALTSARVPYREHDVAGDEEAKKLWKRKNGGKNELPFVLVDGEPVGSIEDMDEAVEFGELRQFLRLDAPRTCPPAAPSSSEVTPNNPSTTTSHAAPAPASTTSTSTSTSNSHSKQNRLDAALSKPKPSIDDFADLDLTEEELASLARELTSTSLEETYSSLLSASQSRRRPDGDTSSMMTSTSNHNPSGGYQFSHTQQFTPSYPSTAPLKLEKVNFVRPIRRPLASEVETDFLEGIDQDNLDEDALERLARELELEEEEHHRRRSTVAPAPERGSGRGDAGERSVSTTTTTEMKTVESSIAPPLGDVTAVEGDGGASLSKPLKQVEALTIPTAGVVVDESGDRGSGSSSQPNKELEPRQIQVEPVSEFETRARAEAERAAAAAPSPPPAGTATTSAKPSSTHRATESSTTTDEARKLKTDAPTRSGESQMPNFGVEAMMSPNSQQWQQRDMGGDHEGDGNDALDKRVVGAIRDGEL